MSHKVMLMISRCDYIHGCSEQQLPEHHYCAKHLPVSDGVVIVKSSEDSDTRMVAMPADGKPIWEVIEHTKEPTVRIVIPRCNGDLSDGKPEPILGEETQIIDVLNPKTKFSILAFMAVRGEQLVDFIYDPILMLGPTRMRIGVIAVPADKAAGEVGAIILRVVKWQCFIDLMNYWLANDFKELMVSVRDDLAGPALFMLRCFAISAREFNVKPSLDGSVLVRFEQP